MIRTDVKEVFVGLLGKILLTAAVIFGALIYLRYRNQRSLPAAPSAPRVVNPATPQRRTIGWVASGVVVIAIMGIGLWLYGYWQEQNAVLYVRVVDAGSGHTSDYRAYRGEIRDREFVTIDGTRVRLAETERLETTTIPPVRN